MFISDFCWMLVANVLVDQSLDSISSTKSGKQMGIGL